MATSTIGRVPALGMLLATIGILEFHGESFKSNVGVHSPVALSVGGGTRVGEKSPILNVNAKAQTQRGYYRTHNRMYIEPA